MLGVVVVDAEVLPESAPQEVLDDRRSVHLDVVSFSEGQQVREEPAGHPVPACQPGKLFASFVCDYRFPTLRVRAAHQKRLSLQGVTVAPPGHPFHTSLVQGHVELPERVE